MNAYNNSENNANLYLDYSIDVLCHRKKVGAPVLQSLTLIMFCVLEAALK